MKKDVFWRIVAGLLVAWLFLFLWMSQWHYYGPGLLKTSNLTGATYSWEGGKWQPIE